MRHETEPERRIYAESDDRGVIVYQAFRPAIVEEAVRLATFGARFALDRMTWIKPSFGWILHRSGYATKRNQERIARVRVRHDGFRAILAEAVPSTWRPEVFETERAWRLALELSLVRYQWDPDRDHALRVLPRRALQLGIRGRVVRRYVSEWIISVEDVTALAHALRGGEPSAMAHLPREVEYPVSLEVARTLALT